MLLAPPQDVLVAIAPVILVRALSPALSVALVRARERAVFAARDIHFYCYFHFLFPKKQLPKPVN